MVWDYDPKEANRTWAEGQYRATIITVKDKTSKAGNSMRELYLEAFNGATRMTLFDYIVRPGSIWKYEQLAEALGEEKAFKAGTFDIGEHEGDSIDVYLVIKDSPEYGKQNRISSYLKPTSAPQKVAVGAEDDDVPFKARR